MNKCEGVKKNGEKCTNKAFLCLETVTPVRYYCGIHIKKFRPSQKKEEKLIVQQPIIPSPRSFTFIPPTNGELDLMLAVRLSLEQYEREKEQKKVINDLVEKTRSFKIDDLLKENCMICLEVIKSDDDAHLTKCSHIFHHDCIIEWFKNSDQCPNCRTKVRS